MWFTINLECERFRVWGFAAAVRSRDAPHFEVCVGSRARVQSLTRAVRGFEVQGLSFSI